MKPIYVTIAIALLLTACTPQRASTTTMGAILPLSGSFASVGTDVQEGIELFRSQHPDLKVIYEDDGIEVKRSISAIRKLRDIDGVTNIIGPVYPDPQALFESQSETDRAEAVLSFITYCEPRYAAFTNEVCIYPSTGLQAKKAIDFANAQGKIRGFIIGDTSKSGDEFMAAAKQWMTINNQTIVGAEQVAAGEANVYATVTKVKQAQVDFVYILMGPPTNVNLAKRMQEQGIDAMVLFAWDIDSERRVEFQDVLEGQYQAVGLDDQFLPPFSTAFQAKFGKTPNHYNAYGYELAAANYAAMQTAPGNKQAVITAVNTGSFAFSDMVLTDDDSQLPLHTKKFVSGDLVLVD